MANDKPESAIVTIKRYFGLNAKEAMAEAKLLTDEDKAQLAEGIKDNSLNY